MLLLPLTAGNQDFPIRLRHNSELSEDADGRKEDEQETTNDEDEVSSAAKARSSSITSTSSRSSAAKARWQIVRTVLRSPTVAEQTGTEHKSVTTVNGTSCLRGRAGPSRVRAAVRLVLLRARVG